MRNKNLYIRKLFLITLIAGFTLHAQAQTTILKDISPGYHESYIDQITKVDSVLYFTANISNENVAELFVTDGTPEGTRKISNIRPGRHPRIEDITPFGDGIIFSAIADDSGREPYISDGTLSGTKLLKDINPGESSSHANDFGVMNGKAYFSATDGTYPDKNNGKELWVTDGTASGTYMLKDIDPGQYLQNSWDKNEKNHHSRPKHFFAHNDTMYFSARKHEYGRELWATDGTASGTYMVKDIFPGTIETSNEIKNGGSPKTFTSINGTVLFSAQYDSIYKHFLYTTDGTEEGTHKFLDEDVSITKDPVEHNGSWYFISGTKLWKSDGTIEGTSVVIDLVEEDHLIEDSFDLSRKLLKFNNHLYFFSEFALWKTDGTKGGTEKAISSFIKHTVSHHLSTVILFNDRIYFSATDNSYGDAQEVGKELWMTDGTPEGTMYVADLRTGTEYNKPDGSEPSNLRVLNDKLYFTAEGDSLGREFWMTDGVPQRNYHIKDTVNTAVFPDFGATLDFANFTDSLNIEAFMSAIKDEQALQIDDSLTLASNQKWVFEAEASGPFSATLCLSLSQITPSSPNLEKLSIIKRTDAQSEWELLGTQVDENEEYLCATDIQSFSEFTIVEKMSATGIDESTPNSPYTFELQQAFPNPFNPTTNIRYSIAEAGKVTLTVYNVLGQEIRKLVDAKQKPGTHSVTFDAGSLSSGVYFYRLAAGENITTNKMTLVK